MSDVFDVCVKLIGGMKMQTIEYIIDINVIQKMKSAVV